METLAKSVVVVVVVVGLFFGIAVLCTIPTYLLWNWLMPNIFGLKSITLLQALGLNMLCRILFKGFNTGSKKD